MLPQGGPEAVGRVRMRTSLRRSRRVHGRAALAEASATRPGCRERRRFRLRCGRNRGGSGRALATMGAPEERRATPGSDLPAAPASSSQPDSSRGAIEAGRAVGLGTRRGGAVPKGAIGDGSFANATTAFSPRCRANSIENARPQPPNSTCCANDHSKPLFVGPLPRIVGV